MSAKIHHLTGARVELVDEPWYGDHVELAELLGWMHSHGIVGDRMNDALSFLEQPWKYTSYRVEMFRERAEARAEHAERLRTDRDYEAEVGWRRDGRNIDPQGPPEAA